MNCPYCNAPVDRDAVFCGNCGHKLVPKLAPGITVAEATQQVSINERTSYPPRGNNSPVPPTIQPGQISEERGYSPFLRGPGQGGMAPAQTPPPQIPPPDRRHTRRTIFLISTLVLLVIVASGALIALLQNIGKSTTHGGGTANTAVSTAAVTTAGGSASAFFSDSLQGPDTTDTIKITTSNLAAPAAGMQYNAWIFDNNTANESITPLGVLQVDQGKNYVLTFTDPNHHNLLSLGSELRITQEKRGTTTAIVGDVVLSAQMPTGAFVHVRHLLLAFNTTPHNVGLLVGTHDQISLLFAQANNLKTASDQNNGTEVQCYAQAIIDIIEGKQGPHAKPLNADCTALNITSTGDGFGLFNPGNGQSGYLALAKAHAGFAAQAADATETIKIHANHVQICITNIQGWVKDIDGDAQTILTNNNVANQVKEINQRASLALNGTDLDNDEKVDPVPGEGGALTAYAHGQLMALLLLEAPHK